MNCITTRISEVVGYRYLSNKFFAFLGHAHRPHYRHNYVTSQSMQLDARACLFGFLSSWELSSTPPPKYRVEWMDILVL